MQMVTIGNGANWSGEATNDGVVVFDVAFESSIRSKKVRTPRNSGTETDNDRLSTSDLRSGPISFSVSAGDSDEVIAAAMKAAWDEANIIIAEVVVSGGLVIFSEEIVEIDFVMVTTGCVVSTSVNNSTRAYAIGNGPSVHIISTQFSH